MSLYKNMQSGGSSYGVVPGNGNPKADDKNMNAAAGHVVPAENAHIAKKVVSAMGYDPNVKVDMNNGDGQGMDIKISSKEYFLNQDQVNGMQQMGIDPEMLSPNSPYNQRVNGGTTKQVKDMVNQKLSMYDLMNNNNNQYPAYQDGGGTGGFPREFQSALYKNIYGEESTPTPETMRVVGNMASTEWPKYLTGESAYQFLEMSPETMSKWDPATGTVIPSASPSASPVSTPRGTPGYYTQDNIGDLDLMSIPAFANNPKYLESVQHQLGSGAWGLDARDPNNPMTYRLGSEYDPNAMPDRLPTWEEKTGTPLTIDTGTEDLYPIGPDGEPMIPKETAEGVDISGKATTHPDLEGSQEPTNPYDKALQDQLDRSEKLTRDEKMAQIGQGIWNLTREYQDLPEPVWMNPSLLKRDYEGMKADAVGDLERNERRAMYQARQLGMDPTQLTGITANTQEGTRKINRSIWDMQQADTMHNIQAENVSKDKYATMKFQRDMANAQGRAAFADKKGQAIADNVREYFGAEEAGLYRDSGLQGMKANREMEQSHNQYKSLDKSKMASDGKRVLESDWNNMTPEEKEQLTRLYGPTS